MRKNNIHPKMERLESVGETLESGELIPSRDEFVKRPCECCGDYLAGERYEVKAVIRNPRSKGGISVKRGTFWVCPDCLYNHQ